MTRSLKFGAFILLSLLWSELSQAGICEWVTKRLGGARQYWNETIYSQNIADFISSAKDLPANQFSLLSLDMPIVSKIPLLNKLFRSRSILLIEGQAYLVVPHSSKTLRESEYPSFEFVRLKTMDGRVFMENYGPFNLGSITPYFASLAGRFKARRYNVTEDVTAFVTNHFKDRSGKFLDHGEFQLGESLAINLGVKNQPRVGKNKIHTQRALVLRALLPLLMLSPWPVGYQSPLTQRPVGLAIFPLDSYLRGELTRASGLVLVKNFIFDIRALDGQPSIKYELGRVQLSQIVHQFHHLEEFLKSKKTRQTWIENLKNVPIYTQTGKVSFSREILLEAVPNLSWIPGGERGSKITELELWRLTDFASLFPANEEQIIREILEQKINQAVSEGKTLVADPPDGFEDVVNSLPLSDAEKNKLKEEFFHEHALKPEAVIQKFFSAVFSSLPKPVKIEEFVRIAENVRNGDYNFENGWKAFLTSSAIRREVIDKALLFFDENTKTPDVDAGDVSNLLRFMSSPTFIQEICEEVFLTDHSPRARAQIFNLLFELEESKTDYASGLISKYARPEYIQPIIDAMVEGQKPISNYDFETLLMKLGHEDAYQYFEKAVIKRLAELKPGLKDFDAVYVIESINSNLTAGMKDLVLYPKVEAIQKRIKDMLDKFKHPR